MAEIYTDGQITPEDSMICVVYNKSNKTIESKKGVKKVDEIEKIALLEGLKQALIHGGKKHNSFVFSDSVVAVKSYYLDDFFQEVREEISNSQKKIHVAWVPREVNLAGIELERRLETVNYAMKSNLRIKKGIRERKFLNKEKKRKATYNKA